MERKSKRWWARADGAVLEVTGYECPNPGVWWCPAVGYSLTEGFHLFSTEYAALDAEIKETEAKMKFEEKRLNVLRVRRTQ